MENNTIEIKRTFFADDIIQVESSLEHNILSVENIQHDILNNIYNFSIITYNSDLAGYIVFSNCIDHTDLISVVIKPKYRGLGLAKNLIKYMEDICTSENLYPIFLEVRVSNLAAINLYEKLGFEKINVRKNYYSNPIEDANIYIKSSPDM